jgi:4-amino-4-deoxy-L-arabinose transferase-like glycosyltransferase
VVTFVLAALFFGFLAKNRMVDDDEGYYALAGRAITEGRIPYRDFFFPQLPLPAYVYGAVRALAGPGLAPLRIFAAMCATLTTLLVQHAARRESGRVGGIAAASLFVFHTLVWEWTPTVKTFPIALPLALASLVVATRPSATGRDAALSGLLAGLTISARSLSAPVVIGIAVALSSHRERAHRLAMAAVGLGVGLLPVSMAALARPDGFWFGVAGYHAIRSVGEGFVKDGVQKLLTARELFLTPFGAFRPDATGLQTTALLVALFVALRAQRALASRSNVAFAVTALATGALAFVPSPAWVQYFAAVVPPATVVVGSWAAKTLRGPWVVAFVVATYAAVAVPSFVDRVIESPSVLRPANLDAVGRAVDAVTDPDARVAAHFPAYLVSSTRRILPASENQFSRLFSDRLAPSDRARYHLVTEDDFREELLRGDARTFVVGAFVVPETALALKDAGWERAADLPGASVWVAPGAKP